MDFAFRLPRRHLALLRATRASLNESGESSWVRRKYDRVFEVSTRQTRVSAPREFWNGVLSLPLDVAMQARQIFQFSPLPAAVPDQEAKEKQGQYPHHIQYRRAEHPAI